jgi:DNA helicase INO80
LVTKNTIEERILRRAQQKQRVQKTVYSGEVFKANFFSSNEVVNLFFDEDELTQHKKDLKIIKDKGKDSKNKTPAKVIDNEKNQNGALEIEVESK